MRLVPVHQDKETVVVLAQQAQLRMVLAAAAAVSLLSVMAGLVVTQLRAALAALV
jgi:flagellar biosynthesis protein FliQ